MNLWKIGVVIFVLGMGCLWGEESTEFYRLEELHRGLHHPWSLEELPSGEILVSERRGRLWVIDLKNGTQQEILGLPQIAAVGQGGLLDLAIAPDFAQSRVIYFTFSTEVTSRRYSTALGKARLVEWELQDTQVLFTANHAQEGGVHFGSRILVLEDESILFSVGDRGQRQHAQNGAIHSGSLLRVDSQGHPPADNPFMNEPHYAPELYSLGHRNIQGLTQDEQGRIFAHEHGPYGGDEVNLILPGQNYGWPQVGLGKEYRSKASIGILPPVPGFESPLWHWSPSIAPSGMMVYSGSVFPQWKGSLFLGALAGKHLARLQMEETNIVESERLVENQVGRIRDVIQGNDGLIYFLTDSRNGKLIRLIPNL
ncbi:MAG: PQQ-dependent sugar dehydrogenase [Spirochaetales bacterium]|nr:PQQ-dependent sugar dehydrogenase [Spirochaetales bacterium]